MWIPPKTDWKNTDYFNLDPDYGRIKANIHYLKEFSERLYQAYSLLPMGTYTVTDFPYADFLNSIVENVSRIEAATFRPTDNKEMRRYAGNGTGWNANDLNIIEGNLLRLYESMMGQWNMLPTLAFTLGGDAFDAP